MGWCVSPNSQSLHRFTASQNIATFLVSCGILPKAWEESRFANNSQESYIVNEYDGVVYVAFPSFHIIESFVIKESKYGEGNIQNGNKFFSGCLKGNDDQPALVHQGALKLFIHIMENTDFQTKMQIYTDSKQRELKPIIFVGHSSGGAVATLATLWVLEKRLRQISTFCITFGCPLVGDGRLLEAVGRENWAGYFCHVVSKHDVVPRILLLPFESIVTPLIAILPFWRGSVTNAMDDQPDFFIQDAYRTLLHSLWQLDTSPYKPFGTYMFCSVHSAACIEDSETVLETLRLTMESRGPASLLEHIRYGSVLKEIIHNSIRGTRLVNSNSEVSYEVGISLQLEAIGLGVQNDAARIAFQRKKEIENKHNLNVAKLSLDLSVAQGSMAEIEWYKERQEKVVGITYYDSFKKQDRKDIDANLRRERLARFWDDIIEMWEKHALPSDFETQNKWINAGTAYRRLVEPLDIAHYYRMFRGKGNYLLDGRPTRHKVLQKWMEEKEKTRNSRGQKDHAKLEKWMEEKEKTRNSRGQKDRAKRSSLTLDSCFWAHVEEAVKDLRNLQQDQHQEGLESLEMFESYVTRMIKDRNISLDVFLEGSSFMEWWKEWKEYKQNQFPQWSSPLYEIMETESWKC